MKKLITSALPYVNNVPHLGNIIGCVLSADAYARFCRLRGYETLYVCGTDEHGTATETRARAEGISPREICDKYYAIHEGIYRDFNISFDIFGRTSAPEQTAITQEIFTDLESGGFISESETEQTFCRSCDMFLADRFVEGTCSRCGYEGARGDQCDACGALLDPQDLQQPRCIFCGSAPVLKKTSHLYLDLDRLQPRLEQWARTRWREGSWTRNAVQATAGLLESGLQSRPITRDLSWGVPVPRPGYEHKVFYVWFDAPIGYISITAAARADWQRWWRSPDEVQLYQFMAKDNIPFHTVIFPASLLGTGKPWTLLYHINSTEYLNYEDAKFSKSRSVGVFGDDVKKTGIPVDLWRFYLLANRPERTDTVFTWHDFFEKVNAEFIDNIGNLTNRTLVYLKKNFDSTIRDFPLAGPHKEFVEACRSDFNEVTEALEEVRLREALRMVLAIGNRGNKFFQDMAPWDAIRTNPDHAHATVSVLAYLLHSISIALEPYMPQTAGRMLDMLNIRQRDWGGVGAFDGFDGHRIGDPEILYRKLDMSHAEKFRKKFSGEAPDFGRYRLAVGTVTAAEKHPGADHLYVLSVDCAEGGQRTLAAGLARHYSPEELSGRKVVVLTNLTPADIKGVTSQGMVLVCEKRNKLELLDASPFENGQIAEVPDQRVDHSEITIDQFKAAPLRVVNGVLMFDDQQCTINGIPVKTHAVKNGKVR